MKNKKGYDAPRLLGVRKPDHKKTPPRYLNTGTGISILSVPSVSVKNFAVDEQNEKGY